MMDRYILDGKTPVLCDDLRTWGRWMETARFPWTLRSHASSDRMNTGWA